jgi:hypothetical protein
MKTIKLVLALVVALAGATLAESALAGGYYYHGGYHGYYGPRVTVGLGFGFGYPYAGYGYGYPYYAPYAYYPPSYAPAYAPQPSAYVEQPAPQAQPQQAAGSWYYCNDSRAYYPYVRECASAWQRVAPQPQN